MYLNLFLSLLFALLHTHKADTGPLTLKRWDGAGHKTPCRLSILQVTSILQRERDTMVLLSCDHIYLSTVTQSPLTPWPAGVRSNTC